MRNLVALGCGLLFGVGLGISQMVDPARVLGFLDVAGNWDPTLAFVMGGALLVTVPAFLPTIRREKPVFATSFRVPSRKDIDGRLIGGASLFGIGWGLVGFCPGPAISSLAYGRSESLVFLAAMATAMMLHNMMVAPGKPAASRA